MKTLKKVAMFFVVVTIVTLHSVAIYAQEVGTLISNPWDGKYKKEYLVTTDNGGGGNFSFTCNDLKLEGKNGQAFLYTNNGVLQLTNTNTVNYGFINPQTMTAYMQRFDGRWMWYNYKHQGNSCQLNFADIKDNGDVVILNEKQIKDSLSNIQNDWKEEESDLTVVDLTGIDNKKNQKVESSVQVINTVPVSSTVTSIAIPVSKDVIVKDKNANINEKKDINKDSNNTSNNVSKDTTSANEISSNIVSNNAFEYKITSTSIMVTYEHNVYFFKVPENNYVIESGTDKNNTLWIRFQSGRLDVWNNAINPSKTYTITDKCESLSFDDDNKVNAYYIRDEKLPRVQTSVSALKSIISYEYSTHIVEVDNVCFLFDENRECVDNLLKLSDSSFGYNGKKYKRAKTYAFNMNKNILYQKGKKAYVITKNEKNINVKKKVAKKVEEIHIDSTTGIADYILLKNGKKLDAATFNEIQ